MSSPNTTLLSRNSPMFNTTPAIKPPSRTRPKLIFFMSASLRLEVLLVWAYKPLELFGQGRLNSERPLIDGKLARWRALRASVGRSIALFAAVWPLNPVRVLKSGAAPDGLLVWVCKPPEPFGQGRLDSEQPLIDGKLSSVVHLMRRCELQHGRFSDLFAIQSGH